MISGFECKKSLLALLLIIICSACATKKVKVDLPLRTSEELINIIGESRIDFQHFYAKAKIKFNGEETRIGGRSRIIMARDSLIWMNFKKLTVEGARVLITPDSTWVLYRLDDLYESGPTQEFLDYYKIYRPFSQLQEMLIGNFPIPQNPQMVEQFQDEYYEIRFSDDDERFEYLINEDLSIFRVLIHDRYGRHIRATFSEYDKDKFATKKEFEIYTPDEGKSTFTIKLSNVEFNNPREIKFDIPDHYTRLP